MKRIKMVLKILILFAAISIPLHSVIMVKADSGWDTSYGGGGSSWGGGGSSYGGGGYSYSYGGYDHSWSSSSSSYHSSGPSRPLTLYEKMSVAITFHYFILGIATIGLFSEKKFGSSGALFFLILIATPFILWGLISANNTLAEILMNDSLYVAIFFVIHTLLCTLSLYIIKKTVGDEMPVEAVLAGVAGFFSLFCYWILLFADLVALGLAYVVFFITNNKGLKKKYEPWYCHDLDESDLKKYFPEDTLNSMKDKVFDIFVKVQMAWMNFDNDALNELCTDELATTYIGQLTSLKVKNGQNIMKNFKRLKCNITSVMENDNIIVINAAMRVQFYDYVINVKTRKVERGKKYRRVCNDYRLVYHVYKHLIDGKLKCPKCGAMIVPNKSGVCEYCHTIISYTNDKMMLAKKEKF